MYTIFNFEKTRISKKKNANFEKVIEHKTRVFTFSTSFSEIYLTPRRTERDMIKTVQGEHKNTP